MNKDILVILIIICTCFLSCVERLDPDIEDYQKYLVVDGILTDDNSAYTVRLRYASEVSAWGSYLSPEENAIVTVVDDLGNDFLFEYKGNGVYKSDPDEFRAEVGREYQLRIETISGKLYESDIQRMINFSENIKIKKEPFTIDKIVNPPGWKDLISDTNRFYKQNLAMYPLNESGFYINAEVQESKEAQQSSSFYRFFYEETWEEYNPWPDAQYSCWPSFYSDEILIASTGDYIKNQFLVRKVDNTTNRLLVKYYIKVKLLTIDEEEYEYLKKIKLLNEDQGGLYDPVPSSITGNIVNCEDDNEKVLGYFSVSAVKNFDFFIDSSEHSFHIYNTYYNCPYIPSDVGDFPNINWDFLLRGRLDSYGNKLIWYHLFRDYNFITIDSLCNDCKRVFRTKPDYWDSN